MSIEIFDIAPKLHKSGFCLLIPAAPYKVSIYRGEGNAGCVVFHALPKASIDLVLIGFSTLLLLVLDCSCWFSISIYTKSFDVKSW